MNKSIVLACPRVQPSLFVVANSERDEGRIFHSYGGLVWPSSPERLVILVIPNVSSGSDERGSSHVDVSGVFHVGSVRIEHDNLVRPVNIV